MKRRIFLFPVSVLSISALFLAVSVKAQTETRQNQQQNQRITVSLGAQNNSNETGMATLTDMGNGRTRVVLRMNNAPANAQPAHIHSGSCPNPGAIKYSLNAVSNGSSDSVINVSVSQLLNQLPLAINVHKSSSEMNVYYSCGNINRPSARKSILPAVAFQEENVMDYKDEQWGKEYGHGKMTDEMKRDMMMKMKDGKMKCECMME